MHPNHGSAAISGNKRAARAWVVLWRPRILQGILSERILNVPFYSCVLSCLVHECKPGCRWPCFDTNLPALSSKCKLVSIRTSSLVRSVSKQGHLQSAVIQRPAYSRMLRLISLAHAMDRPMPLYVFFHFTRTVNKFVCLFVSCVCRSSSGRTY